MATPDAVSPWLHALHALHGYTDEPSDYVGWLKALQFYLHPLPGILPSLITISIHQVVQTWICKLHKSIWNNCFPFDKYSWCFTIGLNIVKCKIWRIGRQSDRYSVYGIEWPYVSCNWFALSCRPISPESMRGRRVDRISINCLILLSTVISKGDFVVFTPPW